MRRVVLLLLAVTCLVEGACERQSTPALAQRPSTRAGWRGLVAWSDECERAHADTFVGSDHVGVRTFSLNGGRELVEVACAAGAYQGSQEYAIIGANLAATTRVELPVLDQPDGAPDTWSRARLVWGTPTFDSSNGQLTILNVSRGMGDCGSLVSYRFDQLRVSVVEARAKRCDASPQLPKDWPVVRHP